MASKPPFPPKPGFPKMGGNPFPGVGSSLPGTFSSAIPQSSATSPQWQAGRAQFPPQRLNEIEALFRFAGAGKDSLDSFLKLLTESQVAWLERFAGGAGSAQDLKYIVDFYLYLRRTTMPVADIARFFKLVETTGGAQQIEQIRKLVSVAPKLDRLFSVVGKMTKPLEILLIYMKLNRLAAESKWPEFITEIYTFAAGKAVPWAGLVNALQSLVESLIPPTAKSTYVFKVIRTLDVVGVSAAGVDAIVYMANGIVRWNRPFDEERLNKLATRLKSGPTAIFYEFGEKIPLGEVLYDLKEMSATKWHQLGQLSLSDLHSTLRRWGQ